MKSELEILTNGYIVQFGVHFQRFIGVGIQVDWIGGGGIHLVLPFMAIYFVWYKEFK